MDGVYTSTSSSASSTTSKPSYFCSSRSGTTTTELNDTTDASCRSRWKRQSPSTTITLFFLLNGGHAGHLRLRRSAFSSISPA